MDVDPFDPRIHFRTVVSALFGALHWIRQL
jgi:hypothetical protein